MIQNICNVMKDAYEKKLITTRDGNASMKYAGFNTMLITPSGVKKYEMQVEQFVEIELNGNGEWRHLGESKPSGEVNLHVKLQENSLVDRAVLHLHPTYMVAAMHAGIELQDLEKDFPEINRCLTREEYEKVIGMVEELKFENGWIQEFGGSVKCLNPDFSKQNPFT